jgi:hypothetical protein
MIAAAAAVDGRVAEKQKVSHLAGLSILLFVFWAMFCATDQQPQLQQSRSQGV